MSKKNRMERRGGVLSSGEYLMGPLSTTFGQIGMMPTLGGNRQAAIERMVIRKLMQISIARFKWTGLPDTVNERWLNLTLMGQALSVFFKDPDNGQFFATQGNPAGNYNMVGDPTRFRAIAANGLKSWEFDVEHCVPIWANDLRWPDLDIISNYSRTLAETDRTIQINLKNARAPKILAYPENMDVTMRAIQAQVDEGNPTISVDSEFGVALKDLIQVLDMSMHPDLIINTSIMRGRIWHECLDLLGINHAPNSDKKERLVSAEVDSNDEIVSIIRRTNLNALQHACKLINAMFPEIASLPKNLESAASELDEENQVERPGVWVEYATNDPDIMDDGEENDSDTEDQTGNTNAEVK